MSSEKSKGMSRSDWIVLLLGVISGIIYIWHEKWRDKSSDAERTADVVMETQEQSSAPVKVPAEGQKSQPKRESTDKTPDRFCGIVFGEELSSNFLPARRHDNLGAQRTTKAEAYWEASAALPSPFRNFREAKVWASITSRRIYKVELRYQFPAETNTKVHEVECQATCDVISKKYGVSPSVTHDINGDVFYRFNVGSCSILLKHVTAGFIDRGELMLFAEHHRYSEEAQAEADKLLRDLQNSQIKASQPVDDGSSVL